MEAQIEHPFALIIANGAMCANETLHFYHSRASEVIVLDGAMHRFQFTGLHAHTLIGDFDLNGHDYDSLRQNFEKLAILHTPDQNATDFEKGIQYAIGKGFKEIIVLWATGFRADHFFTNCANLIRFDATLGISIIDDHSLIYSLPRTFEKWYPAKTILSLIPIQNVSQITSSNLRYPLDGITLKLGIQNGNSNEVLTDGLVHIQYKQGALIMMECQD
jgi:thiamine pyrophosphokinase